MDDAVLGTGGVDLASALAVARAALESTADGLLIVDSHGRVAGLNTKFLAMWRIPQDLAATMDDDRLLAFVLPQVADPDGFVARIRELYEQPDTLDFTTIEFRDGRCFERYSQPHVVDGQTIGRVFSFRDMTARQHAERERLQTQAAVLSGVRADTVGVIVERVAHDINNLLTVISEGTSLAADAATGLADRRRVEEDIQAAAARLLEDVRPPQRRLTCLAEATDSAVKLARAALPDGVTLEVRHGHPAVLFADPLQVQQAVSLLIDHCLGPPPAACTVQVSTDAVPFDQLRDLPAVPQAALFGQLTARCVAQREVPPPVEPSAHHDVTTPASERELGVAIARRILARHGGGVRTTTTADALTIDTYWPATGDAVADEHAPPPPGPWQILVVDDEKAVARVVALSLRRLGFDVTVCTDPRDALSLLASRSAPFDVMITDWSMPMLSGLDLGRAVNRLHPATRLILTTGYSGTLTLDEVRAAGFHDLLHKPLTASVLAESLHRVRRRPIAGT
jgi:CheY-like chemotaxis protein